MSNASETNLRERLSALAAELKAALEDARQAREAVRLATAKRDDVWFWQGGGNDPDSLSCPVVMSAETLRELLGERAEGALVPPSKDEWKPGQTQIGLFIRTAMGSTIQGVNHDVVRQGQIPLFCDILTNLERSEGGSSGDTLEDVAREGLTALARANGVPEDMFEKSLSLAGLVNSIVLRWPTENADFETRVRQAFPDNNVLRDIIGAPGRLPDGELDRIRRRIIEELTGTGSKGWGDQR